LRERCGIDTVPDAAVLSLERRHGCRDDDGIVHLANFQLQVHSCVLVDLERHPWRDRYFEAGTLGANRIRPGGQVHETIGAGAVGDRGAHKTGILPLRGDRGPSHGATGFILDLSED